MTDERDRRALEETMTVLPDTDPASDDLPPVSGVPRFYLVVSTPAEHVVDMQTVSCSCPDFRYRGLRCKHIRRVEFVTGDRDPLTAGVDPADAHDRLGEHI